VFGHQGNTIGFKEYSANTAFIGVTDVALYCSSSITSSSGTASVAEIYVGEDK
jgi:hypothetical protein